MKVAALTLLAILTALRLWLAAALPVTPLEAYQWLCANRLDWAFFDGPGGTAWLVHISSQILGDGPIGLRIAFPLLAAAASLGVFLLGRALFGITAGIWAAAALNALPFLNAAAVHAGPAMPALVFVIFAAWAFVLAVDRGVLWWTLGGLFLALAEQFDYTSVLLLPGIAAACACSVRHRIEWRRPGIYIAAFISFTALVPAYEWNAVHDWPLLAGGTLRTALTPRWAEIGGGLRETLVLFSVFAFAAAAFALWKLAQAARLHFKPRLSLCLAAPFILLWLYDALHGETGATALLLAAALLAGAAAHVFLAEPRLGRIGATTLLLTALFTALTLPSKRDPWSQSTHGIAWNAVASSLDELIARAQSPQKQPPILIAQDADATSALNYHLSRTTHPEVFLRESQDVSNQYGLWPRYDDFTLVAPPAKDAPVQEGIVDEGITANPYEGRDALYITTEEPGDLPQTITAAFVGVVPFATLEVSGNRKLRVYLCEDYKTMSL
jgi:4-amino-4-deoxy-L-arabinose transferase-like glycosyltransferase